MFHFSNILLLVDLMSTKSGRCRCHSDQIKKKIRDMAEKISTDLAKTEKLKPCTGLYRA